MIGYYLLLAVAVLLAISLGRSWWKTGHLLATPLPKPYRDRESQEDVWRQRYPAESLLVDLDREFGLEDFPLDTTTPIAAIVDAVLETRP